MATKSKKVTYKEPAEDNADYLEPLQDNPHSSSSTRTRSKVVPVTRRSAGFYGSVYYLIILILYAGVPISQFVIGCIYVGQCTVRPFIYVYMILSGAFGIMFIVVGFLLYNETRQQTLSSYESSPSNPDTRKILFSIFIVLFIFVIGWFIAGQVIVFQVKLRVEFFDPDLPEYCHGNLYKPAWILIFVDYLLMLVFAMLIALSCMSTSDEKTKKRQQQELIRAHKITQQ